MNNSAHGGANGDYQIDGLTTATVNGFGGGSIVFRIAQAYTSEVNVMTGGGMAETAYGSMVTNVIPQTAKSLLKKPLMIGSGGPAAE